MSNTNDDSLMEYYERFPSVLKKALKENKVRFFPNLCKEYQPIEVYRSVRIVKNIKEVITKEDFYSQVERDLPGVDKDDIGNYSCSCFETIEEIWDRLHYPKKNKKIAKGVIYDNEGPIAKDKGSTHIHWFLYDGVDPSDRFEVINYEKVDNS